MNYLDTGFNQFFQRNLTDQTASSTPFDRDISSEGFSADRIEGGKLRSLDGDTIINLEEGYISVSSRGVERIRLGKIDSDTAGLLISTPTGKPIIKITEFENFIRSPDGATAIEFDLNRITVKENNETGPVRVLLGYDPAGF